MHFFLKSLYIIHIFCKKFAKFTSFCNQNKLYIKCLNRWKWHFGVLVFKIFRRRIPPTSLIGRTFSARMFTPPPSLCITNFIVEIIVLNRPSKPGNTNSVSQNSKNLGKHTLGHRHYQVCPPHFLERIVALVLSSYIMQFITPNP